MVEIIECLDGYGGEDAILPREDRIEVAREPSCGSLMAFI
jgi:hypothetical protein